MSGTEAGPRRVVARFLDNKMYIGKEHHKWVLTPLKEEAHPFLAHGEIRRAAYIMRSGFPYEIEDL